MATDSHVKSVTNTLTSTTADEITLTQLWPVVRITNHDASTWLYARQDGTTAVAEADGTTAIAPNTTRAVKGERAEGTNTIVVSVVGDGNTYTVEGVNGADIDIAELQADVEALNNVAHAPLAVGESVQILPHGYKASTNWSSFLTQNNVDTYISSGAQHAEIEYGFAVPAGTYTIRWFSAEGSNRGIYHVDVDGVEVGTEDGYAVANAAVIHEITGIVVADAGSHDLTFRMATKNASSSNYFGIMGAIVLLRTA